MVGVPVGDKMIGLGTGDLAIPLAFTVSVLRDSTVAHAIITSIGGLVGLIILFAYILNKKDIVLPALPPLAAGLIIGYGVGMIF
jgi:presenilin-like A22 family membrane protease